MRRLRTRGEREVYAAAGRVVDAGLRQDGSVFTPGAAIWTLANAEDLYERFVQQPDESSDTFLHKLQRQLAGAAPASYQLMGELLFLHFLFDTGIGGQSKRNTIRTVLSWSPAPVEIPADLAATLDHGLASAGVAFKTYRPFQLWFLIEFLRRWKRLDTAGRDRLLADPWEFKRFVLEVPMRSAYTQREALLHLVQPDTFEPIASQEHKKRIVRRLSTAEDDTSDVDRALASIRARLEAETGRPIDFYEPPVAERWQPPSSDAVDRAAQVRRAWLVRGANVDGHNVIRFWLADGYCSVSFVEAGELLAGSSREAIHVRVRESYPDEGIGQWRSWTATLWRFLSQMRTGDVVVTADGDDVYVGVITSEPYWEEAEPVTARRREVEWANPDKPIRRRDLSPSAFSKLRSLLTVVDVTEDLDELLTLAGLKEAVTVAPGAPGRRVEARLPKATEELAKELLYPLEWLEDALALLEEKRQIVLYGPPGTGKTYTAQALARHATREGGTYTLVQFHPSYAYEDFFEGFRPRQAQDGSATLGYELVPGPLRLLADEARNNPQHPYVLVIDELNRANLATVFGELYFLLEYRDEEVTLQYSPEQPFSLPRNLFLIATMNTADRWIGQVDAAVRRRFYFLPFFPSLTPIDGLLRRWLTAKDLDTYPADLLDRLNRRLDEVTRRVSQDGWGAEHAEDYAIGPAYLMHHRISEPRVRERIWRHAILPLLEERFQGAGVDVEREFGLEALAAMNGGRAG